MQGIFDESQARFAEKNGTYTMIHNNYKQNQIDAICERVWMREDLTLEDKVVYTFVINLKTGESITASRLEFHIKNVREMLLAGVL